MANLITTTAQLKQFQSAFQWNANFASFVSFELDAQILYLVPAIGQTTYNLLATYNGTNATWLNAVQLFQKAEVNFIATAWVNYGSVQISEMGIHVIQDDKRKIASDKKVSALRKQAMIDAWTALEMAINYLENNLSVFTDYAASPQHAQNRSHFINTTIDFNGYFFINYNAQLFNAIGAVMTNAEKQYIEPALGPAFTAALRTAILNGTYVYGVSASLQKQLIDAIGAALAPLTIAEAIPFQMLEIDADGVVTNSVGNGGQSAGNTELQQPADAQKLQKLMNACVMRGNDNLARLRQFLNANASSFTDYATVDTQSSAKINNVERGNYFL